MSSVSRFCREHTVDSFSNMLHGRNTRINFICDFTYWDSRD